MINKKSYSHGYLTAWASGGRYGNNAAGKLIRELEWLKFKTGNSSVLQAETVLVARRYKFRNFL